MASTVFIVGVRGQDGSLLKDRLEVLGVNVVGISQNEVFSTDLGSKISKHNFSIINPSQVEQIIESFKPKEIYYLAAHHFSSEQYESGYDSLIYDQYHRVHVVGLINFLSAIVKKSPLTRLFYASSSLVFSGAQGPIQNESTPFTPEGYYGLTKTQGILLCREYRKKFSIYASTGILYNHESCRRKNHFFSKKVINAAHNISLGLQNQLVVGSLDSQTDWGYAPDFINAFQQILSVNNSDDFIVASGEAHTAREFIEIVFNYFQIDYKKFVRVNESLLNRKPPIKIGDIAHIKAETGWAPTMNFESMVKKLVLDYLSDIEKV
jgi:GDPmannose 4,6-dehydratase